MTKYIILVGDGMGDYPIDALGGQSPLAFAHTPNMDYLADYGLFGTTRTIPEGSQPGSDIANMSILGYDPLCFHTGRSPLEAASMGVELASDEVAFRCNLVTLTFSQTKVIMEDYSAGHITSSEAKIIIRDLQSQLGDSAFRFYPGVGYRHLMVWKGGCDTVKTLPPHDLTGQEISEVLKHYEPVPQLHALMNHAQEILKEHPINSERVKAGKRPANAIWLWGQGYAPKMPTFQSLYGLKGGMISAVDLLKGLGIYAGLKPIDVEGATGYLDTNYKGKVDAAIDTLSKDHIVYLHVEAPDEASHHGNLKDKLTAIQDFDHQVVGPMLQYARDAGHCRILLLPDHYTPICKKTHMPDPVPFCLFDSIEHRERRRFTGFNEYGAQKTGLHINKGHEILALLLGKRV